MLADRAPSPREALEKAEERGLPYLILRHHHRRRPCAEKTISRKGREIPPLVIQLRSRGWSRHPEGGDIETAAHKDGPVKYTAHELRHVCASLLIASGATECR